MINSKIDLFLENSKALENVNGARTMYGFQMKINALSYTIKNQRVDTERINLALDIIKSNTKVFSNFRGINKLTTAITISFEDNMEESLKEIIEIYNMLREKFSSSEYLVMAAQVIFNGRDRISREKAVENTRIAYEYMKKHHKYLTSHEDITNAAIIATISSNLEETFKDIEESYEYLKVNKIASRNNIQGLSHILSLINLSSREKCDAVLKVNYILKERNVPLKEYYVPMLGIIAFLGGDKQEFAYNIAQVSTSLKKEKGFGNFVLGADCRNMIAATLVSMEYIDSLDNSIKKNIINNANNIALTISMVVQTAMLISFVTATTAATAATT